MRAARAKTARPGAKSGEATRLRARLAEAEEALRAIRTGEVDTVVVAGRRGRNVFTLQGAEHAYRMLIECMNEGALMLTADKLILYSNACFARLVKCPLEQVMGGSMRRFLCADDRTKLRLLLKRAGKAGSKIQVMLLAADGSRVPAQISIRPLDRNGFEHPTFGMVVSDMTEAHRNEELLRALTHRVVEAQEAERGRVSLELHDHITQLLCAVLFRSQALADSLPARDGKARKEATRLREMLGETAEEVERISRNLRPGVLEQLGLATVLRSSSREFADQTGVPVDVACVELAARLPAATELALFRIHQEALKNVGRHARARHVTVRLTQPDSVVELTITDDGIGFDADPRPSGRTQKRGLGLLGMGERAGYVGGTVNVQSARGKGTTVQARIPLSAARSGSAPA